MRLHFRLNKYIGAFPLNGNQNFYTILVLRWVWLKILSTCPWGRDIGISVIGAVSLEEREILLSQQSDHFELLGIRLHFFFAY